MKMAILMNHSLSEVQSRQAETQLGVSEFALPTEDVALLWSKADPSGTVNQLGIEIIIAWLEKISEQGDYVLVQGDYGLTFAVADWCLSNGRRPVHATTVRKAVEIVEEGVTVVKREFRHVRFREYERYLS